MDDADKGCEVTPPDRICAFPSCENGIDGPSPYCWPCRKMLQRLEGKERRSLPERLRCAKLKVEHITFLMRGNDWRLWWIAQRGGE